MRDGDELRKLAAAVSATRSLVQLGEYDHVGEELLILIDKACERMSLAALDARDRKYEKEKR